MTYIDFHTHAASADKSVLAVVDGRDTWGIHPWEADSDAVFPADRHPKAIGECGLDALRGPSLEVQAEAFIRQIELSEAHGLPLIVHCVKAIEPLLRIRREMRPVQPWLYHGFRGKPQQLMSLISAGFYVSFGFHYNAESLRCCPADRLCLETDTDPRPIGALYAEVALQRSITEEDLCAEMAQKFRTFFQIESVQIQK